MRYYLGKLMYYMSDDPGAICEGWAASVLIKSDDDLKEVKPYELNNYYEIRELLDNNDCEEIHLVEIDEDEYNDYMEDVKNGKMESLFINRCML